MSQRGHKGRTDANQTAIIGAARAMGWVVRSTAAVGDGFVDAVACRDGRVELWEIKDGRKPPSKRALTPDEIAYHAELARVGVTAHVIASVDDVLARSSRPAPIAPCLARIGIPSLIGFYMMSSRISWYCSRVNCWFL